MRIFISHSVTDKELVEELVRRLSREGFEVWYDEAEVLPGDNYARKVAEAMEESNAMVIVLSSDAVRSPWVTSEIDYALSSTNYKNRVITVVADNKADVPWILRRYPIVEVRKKNFAEASRRVVEELREVASR